MGISADEGTAEGLEEYLLEGESVAYSFSHRPTGILNWAKSLVGYGTSYWHVTDRRLLVYREGAGGFGFQEVPLAKVTSVSYDRKFDRGLLALGLITLPILLGVLVLLYAFLNRKQTLEVFVSGGTHLSVVVTRGSEIDDILWYLPAQRALADGSE